MPKLGVHWVKPEIVVQVAFTEWTPYDKLRQYCVKLAETPVRGRTPSQIVADEAARQALYVEVDDEIKKTVPVIIKDPEDAEVRLKAYLNHKLK